MNFISSDAMMKALPAVVSFITGKTNVPVVRGHRAKTNSTTVTIPAFSDWFLTSDEVVKAIAYIYHESFHILWSNFSLGAENPLKRAITGCLEDIRIELKGMQLYPAARYYLSRLVEILTTEGFAGKSGFTPVGDDDCEAKVVQAYMRSKLRHELLRHTGIKPALEAAERQIERRFSRGFAVRLDALMFEVAKCESEDDVFELADAIIQMLKDEEEQQQQQPDQQADNGDEDSGDAQSAPGDGQSEDGSEEEQGAAGGGDQQEDGEQSSSSADAGGKGAGSGPSAEEIADALQSLLNMGDGDVADSIDEMLEASLNQLAADQWQSGNPMVTQPSVFPMRLREGTANLDGIRAATNAIRTKTLSWMATVGQSSQRHTRAGTQIDFSRLHLAPMGGAIFTQEDEGIELNAAISIMIDRSGSMKGCIQDAVRAATAAMLAYDTRGIKTHVSVFPVRNGNEEGIAVIKDWNESPRKLASRIQSLDADGGTPMAEAVMFAATSLAFREESLKIVLVVTDGAPNDREATRAIIDKARASGVAIVGLGIGCDTSHVFGEKYAATVQDVGSLAGAMVRLIKSSVETTKH